MHWDRISIQKGFIGPFFITHSFAIYRNVFSLYTFNSSLPNKSTSSGKDSSWSFISWKKGSSNTLYSFKSVSDEIPEDLHIKSRTSVSSVWERGLINSISLTDLCFYCPVCITSGWKNWKSLYKSFTIWNTRTLWKSSVVR